MIGPATYVDRIYRRWRERRVTDCVREVLIQVPARAAARGLQVVDERALPTLVLWSLVQWEQKLGLIALQRSGVDRFSVARDLDGLLEGKVDHAGSDGHWDWDFESAIEPYLDDAEKEAQALGHSYVGSEHLLLTAIRRADSDLSDVLAKHGINHDRIAAAVKRVLSGECSDDADGEPRESTGT